MSQTTVSAPPQSQPTSQTQTQTQSHSQSLPSTAGSRNPFAKFDGRIADISDNIIPKQPYLVTIPSDFPYRRHYTDPNRWYSNTPFIKQEEQLQYMSLLLHQDDDEALLRVDGSRIDEDGRLQAYVPSPASEFSSRPQTPVENAPKKKKISLKDYKTKDKSTLNTPERLPGNDMRKQAIKSHKEEADAKRSESLPLSESKARPKMKDEQPVKHTVSPAPNKPPQPRQISSTQHDPESERPTKKRRLSTDKPKHGTANKPQSNAEREPLEKRALPDLLSPDMPGTTKKSKPRGLPELLSPKLPAALEKAAAAQRSASGTPLPRSDEVRAIMKNIEPSVRLSDKKSTTTPRESSPSRGRSDSQTSAKPANVAAKGSSPAVKPLLTTAEMSNGRTASPKPRQRHRITLRFNKKNRKIVERLLRLEPRHKKEPAATAAPARSTAVKAPAPAESAKVEKKRPAEPTSEQPAKKAKLHATSQEATLNKPDRPSTPKVEAAVGSPKQNAKSKSTFSTPRKTVPHGSTSIAMQRVASTDTADARTPSADNARISTPSNVTGSSHQKMSPAATSTPAKNDDLKAWIELQERIFQLGRALKKEGQELAHQGEGKVRQQGVLLLIEALLCFMLNSAAQAQSRPNSDPQWYTILPYLQMVTKLSRSYPHLYGLVIQLGAICRQYIQHEHYKRLAKETLPDDHLGSAPTPGSDGTTRNSDDTARKQKSFLELRDDMVSNAKELKIAWLESSRRLPYNLIEEQYTKTWRRRAEDFSKRHPEKLNPRELPKDYYIPLDVSTNCFEATNFALAFLSEWAMIEEVKWKARIEL